MKILIALILTTTCLAIPQPISEDLSKSITRSDAPIDTDTRAATACPNGVHFESKTNREAM